MTRLLCRLCLATTALLLALAGAPALAQSCPDWTLVAPKTINATSDRLRETLVTGVTAGGFVDLTDCPEVPGIGYLQKAPDLSLQFDDQDRRRLLDLRVEGDCDTMLLINMPDGTYIYADDEDGLNPVVRIQAADGGLYDIWVGTIEAPNCASILRIRTDDPAV